MRLMVIPIVVDVLGTILMTRGERLEKLEIRGKMWTVQATALIVGKVREIIEDLPSLRLLQKVYSSNIIMIIRRIILRCFILLWEPYPSYNKGLFSPLLVQRFRYQKGRSLSVLYEQSETSYLFYVTLSFSSNIICYLISVFAFSLVTLSGATTHIKNKINQRHHHRHHHHVVPLARYPWPSLATSPYLSSLLAGLQVYIPHHHIAAVCMFELVVLLLLGHMRGSIGVHHWWARPCFPSSVLRVWFV